MIPLLLIGTINGLLIPIQQAIAAVMPDFLEAKLDDPAVRKTIVLAADKALLPAAPEARRVPKQLRHRIISRSLNTPLDELLLPA